MKNLHILLFAKSKIHLHIRLLSISLLVISGMLLSFTYQSTDRTLNQRVFNILEFHLSQHQSDSVYQWAAPEFKQAVSLENFKSLLTTQIYPMGKIQSAKMVEFDSAKKIGKYRIDFDGITLQMLLSINEDRKFNLLVLQPYTPTREESLPVIRSVSKEDRLNALVQELAQGYIRKPQTKALAIGIITPTGVESFYFGQKSAQSQQKPDSSSVFEIGSISKTFTAGLLALMVRSGQIQLQDRILPHLPDSLQQTKGLQNITFESLANHTSGLPRLPDNLDKIEGYQSANPYMLYDEASLFQYLQSFKQAPNEYPEFQYSNLGYALLGVLLEKISGTNYATLLDSLIAKPLSMAQTWAGIRENPNILPVYASNGRPTPVWDFQAFQAAGGIKSTLPDLINFAKAQLRTPYSELENAFAETRQFSFFIPPDTDIGLAWHINLLGDQMVYWHNGGTGGSRSYIGLSPDKRSAVIILANSDESVDAIGVQLFEEVLK